MSDMNNDLLDDEYEDEFDEDAQKDRFLTFQIGKQEFGIEILHVTEIVGIQEITEVPDVEKYVKGVINLRGNVIPIIDIRLRFGKEERDYDDRTCVIVVTVSDSTVGLVVDRVREVSSFPESTISPPPKIGDNEQSAEYIMGMGRQGEDVTILLDLNSLLYEAVLSE